LIRLPPINLPYFSLDKEKSVWRHVVKRDVDESVTVEKRFVLKTFFIGIDAATE
jgi:hypothetical protein